MKFKLFILILIIALTSCSNKSNSIDFFLKINSIESKTKDIFIIPENACHSCISECFNFLRTNKEVSVKVLILILSEYPELNYPFDTTIKELYKTEVINIDEFIENQNKYVKSKESFEIAIYRNNLDKIVYLNPYNINKELTKYLKDE